MDESIESLQKGFRDMVADIDRLRSNFEEVIIRFNGLTKKIQFLNKKCFELEREVSELKHRVSGLEKAGEGNVW